MKRLVILLIFIDLTTISGFGQKSEEFKIIKECFQNDDSNCEELVISFWDSELLITDSTYLNKLDRLCQIIANSADLDYAITQNLKFLEKVRKLGNKRHEIYGLRRLASLYENKSNWERCEEFNRLAIELSKKYNADQLSLSLVNYANYHRVRGKYQDAQKIAIEALKIAEQQNNNEGLFKSYSCLSNIYNMNKMFDKAYEYRIKAGNISLSLDDDSLGYIVSYSSAATVLMGMQQFDSAQKILLRLLPLMKKRSITRTLAMTNTHIGTTYIRAGNYLKAKYYYDIGLRYAQESKNKVVILYVHRMLASYYLELKDNKNALDQAHKALSISELVGINQNTLQIIETLAEIHSTMGNKEKSLTYEVEFYKLKDSLIGSRTNVKMAEMEKSYEDEIKLKEIDNLKSEAKIRKWRNTLGFVGLGLLVTLAWLLVNRQRMKIKSTKKIAMQKEELHKEQLAIEQLERENLALELEQNRRELTGKALHIAEKNELLGQLESQLKSVNTNDVKSIEKILRSIKISSVHENDWNQFVSVFENVHPDFIAKLTSNYENLTASDVRLSTLIKMNFNTKQIAAILHISELGVKKARYRLRKKLELNEEDSLESIVIKIGE